MSDMQQHGETSQENEGRAELFTIPKAEPMRRGFLFAIAAAVLLVACVAGVLLVRSQHDAGQSLNAQHPPDAYANNLVFTQLAMSQSSSLSGGTSTFLDGRIRNSGGETLTGIVVQVVFKNDVGLAPRVDVLPLSLVRTHEPYLDTQPVSAAPLKPGDEVEFRLIFETIPSNWNQQMPDLTVVRTTKK